MKPIYFTQFLRPHGHRQEISIAMPDEVWNKAMSIKAMGLELHAEVLTTGEINLTVTDEEKGDLAQEIVANGPEVPKAVERLIMDFAVPA